MSWTLKLGVFRGEGAEVVHVEKRERLDRQVLRGYSLSFFPANNERATRNALICIIEDGYTQSNVFSIMFMTYLVVETL